MANDGSLHALIEEFMVSELKKDAVFKTVDYWNDQIPEDPNEIANLFGRVSPFAFVTTAASSQVVRIGSFDAHVPMHFLVLVGTRNTRGQKDARIGDGQLGGVMKLVETAEARLDGLHPKNVGTSVDLVTDEIQYIGHERTLSTAHEFVVSMTFIVPRVLAYN